MMTMMGSILIIVVVDCSCDRILILMILFLKPFTQQLKERSVWLDNPFTRFVSVVVKVVPKLQGTIFLHHCSQDRRMVFLLVRSERWLIFL